MVNKNETNRSYLFGRLYGVMNFILRQVADDNQRTYVEVNLRNIVIKPKQYLMRTDELVNSAKRHMSLKNQEMCQAETMEIYDLFEKDDFTSTDRVDEKFNMGYQLETKYLWDNK